MSLDHAVDGTGSRPRSAGRRSGAVPVRWERALSLALFGALVLWVALVYGRYGVSNDEPVQQTYGELLWAWYASGLTDDRAFHYINLYLYGGLFDMLAVGLEKLLPLPLYDVRHLLSAGFGLLGLLGVHRLASRLYGEAGACLAVALLTLTGMYGGAMFTHTKDVPFAAMMVWALYFTTRLAETLPERPTWGTVTGLGLAVGAAMGLRVGGVFTGLYLALTLGGAALLLRDWRAPLAAVPRLLVAGAIAFALMAVTWPWAVTGPTHVLEAMTTFSNFDFDLSTLFAGKDTPLGEVPSDYMVTYLLIKLPEASLVGLALALGFGATRLVRGRVERRQALVWLPLVLAVAVPVVFTLAARPALYNGIRHFLFVLPPVTVLAAAGYVALWRALPERPVAARGALAVLAGGLLAWGGVNVARLHPYEYLGYNLLVGGLPGATGRYEGDYWAATLPEAIAGLKAFLAAEHRAPPRAPYRIGVCAEPPQAEEHLGPGFEVVDDWDEADVFITATNVGCDGEFQAPVIVRVEREGVELGLVRDLRRVPGHRYAPDAVESVP